MQCGAADEPAIRPVDNVYARPAAGRAAAGHTSNQTPRHAIECQA